MLDLIIEIGSELLFNLIQLIVGTLLAAVIHFVIHNNVEKYKQKMGTDFVLIIVFSIMGTMLPFETYGVLPIFLVFLQMGLKACVVLPLLLSNTLFNLLVPYNDPSFLWRNSYNRVILAVLLGALFGCFIQVINTKSERFKLNTLTIELESTLNVKFIIRYIHNNINLMGVYLIIGVVLNVLFNKYILFSATDAFFLASDSAGVTLFLSHFNIVHPLFLLGVSIIYALMNFIKISGLLVVIKPKGVAIYLVFCGVCAALLSCSIFI